MPKPKVITLGCRLNKCESDVISGFETDIENLIVINSCAVTKEAARQSRQAIRRAHKENPDSFIIVTGCAVELYPEEFAEIEGVDRIISNAKKASHKSFMRDFDEHDDPCTDWNYERSHKYRAYLEIQNGCNHSCAFCSVPITRGKSKSVPLNEVIERARMLVDSGANEIILTGVDITAYGEDFDTQVSLSMMIRRLLNNIPSLLRLRISSIDPKEVDEDLLLLICEEPRIMAHIHMSLQSGDDTVLSFMERRHRAHDVITLCTTIRSKRPSVRFGADVIAGFPCETDDMFLNTCNLIKKCGFTFLHVFGYSIREGTKAAEMEQIPKQIIKERAHALREISDTILAQEMQNMVGKEIECLLETDISGHSNEFFPVIIGPGKNAGSILKCVVKGIEGGSLLVESL